MLAPRSRFQRGHCKARSRGVLQRQGRLSRRSPSPCWGRLPFLVTFGTRSLMRETTAERAVHLRPMGEHPGRGAAGGRIVAGVWALSGRWSEGSHRYAEIPGSGFTVCRSKDTPKDSVKHRCRLTGSGRWFSYYRCEAQTRRDRDPRARTLGRHGQQGKRRQHSKIRGRHRGRHRTCSPGTYVRV